MKSFSRIIPIVLILTLVGAGCWNTSSPSSTPTSSASGDDADMTTTLSAGGSASSTTPAADVHWDRTSTPGGVAFAPPKGYWVTIIENLHMMYLIPGAAPAPSTPDPRAADVLRAVATMSELQDDPNSFPSWDKFIVAIAQFGCASGTSEKDFVTCGSTPMNVSTGKTDGGLSYKMFSLPATLKSTGASRGQRTYIAVHLADDSVNGILVSVLDPSKTDVVLQLAKSMKVSQ